ncbi:MAG TPA: MFS transporter [Anaerolineae bacterium]|jgi:predicted MFS family arabinose efflux permease|nr:MFS transporter [Anaerolineae bacterium]
MIATLRNRNFFLLWSGGLISMIGTWMLLAALPFYIYSVTGSALATSGLLMAYLAPGALFGSIAGVFVDRWDRKRVLVIGNLIQAAIIPVLLLVDANGWIWLVYVVAFLESTVNQFLGPAENALLPTLVDEEHLVSANSMNALNDNLARIIGAALGGILLGMVGFRNVVLFDALSFLAAAALIAFVVVKPVVQATAAEAAANVSRWLQVWREWISGLRLVADDNILRNLFIVIGVALFGDAILSALLAVFAQDVAGFSATDFGWLLTARGIGGIAGGIVIAQFGSKFSNSLLITGGLILTGLGILVMVTFPTLMIVVGLMILAGPFLMAWIIGMQTVLQQATDDSFRGRVFGAYGTTSTILMFVGAGLAGMLADTLGASALMASAAVIYVVAGMLGWVLLSKPLSQAAAPATP